MGNRSLDEFLDGGSDPGSSEKGADTDTDGDADRDVDVDADETVGCETGADETVGDRSPAPAGEPAASTYARDPAGGPCAACGETVERRWESEDGLVCPECKEW